jgi:hypothetical protein
VSYVTKEENRMSDTYAEVVELVEEIHDLLPSATPDWLRLDGLATRLEGKVWVALNEGARTVDPTQALLWLNDRLGHVVEAQVLLATPSLSPAGELQLTALLRSRGVLQYWTPQEINEAPYPLAGRYLIGEDGTGDLSLSDLLPRAGYITLNKRQLGMRLSSEISLLVRDLTPAGESGGDS